MNRKHWLVLIISALVLGSAVGFPLYFYHNKIILPPFVINSYPITSNIGDLWHLNITVTITGGCQRLLPEKIDIQKNKLSVEILIRSKYQRNVVCPRMVFDIIKIITISFPLEGNWSIYCNDFILYVDVS